MKSHWNRANVTLFGKAHLPKTLSGYFDYDLRCWLVGFSFEIDLDWYEIRMSLGPVGASVIWWRHHIFIVE
jgi:hypothetical protein